MRQLIRDIWDAVRGYEHDYTRLGLGKAILLLAIPMVLEMMMESVFALFDIFYVSRLGDESIAVVGLTESMMSMIYAIAVGLSMATTGLVARRIGEKKDREASVAATQSILLGILISVIIAIPGVIYARQALSLMHAEPEVLEIGADFTRIMAGSNGIIMLLFINNAIFRSAGSPALAMRVLLLANILNIILDPCLIFGWGPFPEMGVTGAAVATTIGRGTGVLYQFYMLMHRDSRIQLRWQDFRLKIRIMWKVLFLSGGGVFQHLIATSSWIILYRILAEFKSEVIAGYTIALRLFFFFLLPSWGISNAAATLVGQNLGAGEPDRAERAVWKTAWINSLYMGIIMLLFLLVPETLIRVFANEGGQSFTVAINCLRIMGIGMIFYGFEMIMAQAFNGAGDTYTPTILNVIGFWLIQIPLAYFLAKGHDMKENGVFYAILLSEMFLALLSILVFRLGRWKTRKV
ncbi:MAG: MATE family efflux transporter [Bacteroidales bacterium]|nr:MATE family efflux transporter [Bacteroidales bacterium]